MGWTRGAQTVDRGRFLFSVEILFTASVEILFTASARSTALRLTAIFGSP
jgi:hypothetical protein